MSQKVFRLLSVAGGSITALAALAQTSLYNVDAGENSIIFDRVRGVLPKVYTEGTHFKIPLLHRPYIFETRCRPKDLSAYTGTR
ncbi:MAG: hypothetical protein MHPSP_001036, partial [Paramarteilia canceri]